MDGWIKLHRKITEWDWYDDANTFRLFIHLLLLANSKDAKWRGENIKRGELITSVAHLSEDLKLSSKQIRLSLEKLKKTSEIGTERANNSTMITIYKYDCYQGSDKTEGQTNGQPKDKPRANEGQTEGNKQEGKEIKKEKKIFIIPSIEEIKDYFVLKNIEDKDLDYFAERFYNFYSSKNWYVGKNKMAEWKAAATNSLKWEDKRAIQPKNNGYVKHRDVPSESPGRSGSSTL